MTIRPLLAWALMVLIALVSLAAWPGGAQSGQGAGQGIEVNGPGTIHLAQATYRRGGASAYLGEVYEDRETGFSMRPPAQWYLDRKNPRYAVKFSARNYEAFIMVDTIALPGPIKIDNEFKKFINEKNKEIKETIPSYQVLNNRPIAVNKQPAYLTEAAFVAGPNRALINVYYIASGGKLFMVTTVCPEATVRNWEKIFQASIDSFTLL